MKIAVIDLGTNTCNLLIAELNDTGFKILHQSKQLVKLGDDKIKTNEISAEATKRVVDSFHIHQNIIEKLGVEKVRVIATSAVRSAGNKISFLEEVSEKTGYVVKVVSGEKEAELIFKGVLMAFNTLKEPAVILDIGGGSNEIITAKDKEILWKESRPTGMSRVINRFDISDPIRQDEIEEIQQFYYEEHLTSFNKCISENITTLIGCSGAFDTIADIIDHVKPGEKQRRTQEIFVKKFYEVYYKLIQSTREERLNMKSMDMVRVDLIVPSVILIEQLISKIGIQKIVQTDFALREGVLFDLINNN